MIPGEIGVFCLGAAWMVTQGWTIPRLLRNRKRPVRPGPADRETGYDTMRVRPRTAHLLTIGAPPNSTDDKNRMDLAA